MKKTLFSVALIAGYLAMYGATTCENGIMNAIPLESGKTLNIDGDLSDWDLSGVESAWIADELADVQVCNLYMMYDNQFLYVASDMKLYDHEYTNPNRPEDRYWRGDLLQLRLSTDKSLPWPLPRKKDNPLYVKNDKVTCVNMWRNTLTNQDCIYITPGANFDCTNTLNPDGSKIFIKPYNKAFKLEARIPWKALGVKDGKNPFSPGEMMTACLDIKWMPGLDGHFAAMIFAQDPGAFAFLNVNTWGRIKFLTEGNLKRKIVTPEEIAQAARHRKESEQTQGATPIRFSIPKDAFVSVNIVDEKGSVIKEVMGGEKHEKGEVTAWWDGRDAFGFPCATNKTYSWQAYLNDGIDVKYFGTVGTSGVPPYETRDGKGGWGGDHGPCSAAIADETGRYFIWYKNESSRVAIKTDFEGNIIWRTAPFVCGGYGAYTAGCVMGDKLMLVFDDVASQHLVQINRDTGNYELFPDGRQSIELNFSKEAPAISRENAMSHYSHNSVGIATDGDRLFVSDYNGGFIRVIEKSKLRFSLACPKPRGLVFYNGVLYVASLDGSIYAIEAENIRHNPPLCCGRKVHHFMPFHKVISGLSGPYGIAFDSKGDMYVSDRGESHQIIKFTRTNEKKWEKVKEFGKKGGRAFLGKYDPDAFLHPAGIAVDKKGVLLVAEMASPKVFSLIDSKTGLTLKKYFGYTAYSPSNIPDCDNPLIQYYSLSGPESFARAELFKCGGQGAIQAQWDFVNAGITEFSHGFTTMTMGEIIKANNNKKYLVPDAHSGERNDNSRVRPIFLVDGDNMKAVGAVQLGDIIDRRAQTRKLEIWTDNNGDGRMQNWEKKIFAGVGGRAFRWSFNNGSIYMDKRGYLYLTTMNNCIVEFPNDGFSPTGAPSWNIEKARIAIPEIVPGVDFLFCSHRMGLVGLRRDNEGNFYGLTAWNPDYVTSALTKKMCTGMGHTSRFSAVKFVKWAPDGKVLWTVGRKATSSPKPGEIMHHWCMAGLIGDDYVVSASEWGTFFIYTKDGFYAGHLFDLPGKPGRGVPYVFGGEDFSGAIKYFENLNEVWAFNAGHTYQVTGFENGRIKGEMRLKGKVELKIVKALDDSLSKVDDLSNGKKVQFNGGYGSVTLKKNDKFVECYFSVKDDSPLVNKASDFTSIFKGGDAVGVELGPKSAKHPKAIPHVNVKERSSYVRILASKINGRNVVIGMKPYTNGEKKEQRYWTPAGGESKFEWMGEIPGASVRFKVNKDGYDAIIKIPRTFFEFSLQNELAAEAEILYSGEGARGIETTRRTYLYSPETPWTSMVNDTPTESRLYPESWGSFK
jgi:hypothetical protein